VLPEEVPDLAERQPLHVQVQRLHDHILRVVLSLKPISLDEEAFAVLAPVSLAGLVLAPVFAHPLHPL
jgi:hypothetical protein